MDFFGPSNLITFMETVPPYWRPLMAMMNIRVGNPDDEADRAMLEEYSPLNHPENITMPIFIVQGENDPRVVKAESDQMVQALRAIGTEVLYVSTATRATVLPMKRTALTFPEGWRNSSI